MSACASPFVSSLLTPAVTFLISNELASIGSITVLSMLLLVRAISAIRARSVASRLDSALDQVVGSFHDTETSQSIDEVTKIRAALAAIRLQGIELRQEALYADSVKKEILLVWSGYPWRVARCFHRVHELGLEIEVCRILKKREKKREKWSELIPQILKAAEEKREIEEGGYVRREA